MNPSGSGSRSLPSHSRRSSVSTRRGRISPSGPIHLSPFHLPQDFDYNNENNDGGFSSYSSRRSSSDIGLRVNLELELDDLPNYDAVSDAGLSDQSDQSPPSYEESTRLPVPPFPSQPPMSMSMSMSTSATTITITTPTNVNVQSENDGDR
jgi:hypothetical protein